MALGYEGSLYILAFDHRGTFRSKLFGISGQPSEDQTRAIIDAKRVIYEGLQKAVEQGAAKNAAGMLVDEEYGTDVAQDGRKDGFVLAMPVEKSGLDEFDFEFGDEFGRHIEEFDPTFAKVLVRYNPDWPKEMNQRQLERLLKLSDWLHERGRKFLYELLVPATDEQLEKAGGDSKKYDQDIRPGLMLRSIEDVHNTGIEPDVWKIEGIDRREECEKIAAAVRSGGRDNVVCVVLGRGANDEAVEHWLRQGSGVPGYVGFAIGRTIWWDPLKSYISGESDRDSAAEQIAHNYLHFIEVYDSAT